MSTRETSDQGRGPERTPGATPGLGSELGLYAATAAIFLAVGPLGLFLMVMFGPLIGDAALTIPLVVQVVAAALYVVLPRREFWRPRGMGDAAALTVLVNVWPLILLLSSGDLLQHLVAGSPLFFVLLTLLVAGVFAGLVARSRGWRYED